MQPWTARSFGGHFGDVLVAFHDRWRDEQRCELGDLRLVPSDACFEVGLGFPHTDGSDAPGAAVDEWPGVPEAGLLPWWWAQPDCCHSWIAASTLRGSTNAVTIRVYMPLTVPSVPPAGGGASYPTPRLMTLVETGTRALIGAVIGSVNDRDEASLARRLLPLLHPGMLLLADRAFDAAAFLNQVAGTGARSPGTPPHTPGRELPVCWHADVMRTRETFRSCR